MLRIFGIYVTRNVSNNKISQIRSSILSNKYLRFNTSLHKNVTRTMGSSNCKSFSPSKACGDVKSATMLAEEYIEAIVCKENDINDNEAKSFDLGEGGQKILLIKQNGVVSAIGSKCTHYGAPLVEGALGDGRVRCQWHGACFNAKTGDIEDFPGLDSLPCFQVTIENGAIKVKAKKSELESSKRTKKMALRNKCDKAVYVMVGGGPSVATCVETLRQEGFTGKIIMICKENYLPYDRIKLSKQFDIAFDTIQLRQHEFYRDSGVELMLNTQVTSIDTKSDSVVLSNGMKIKYDKCYIATGCKPRRAEIPGNDLKNVCVIRDFEDVHYISTQLSVDKEIVILGSSFIALEAAAYCVDKVSKVTVIARDDVPLKPVFGAQIGARIKQLFEDKGITFITQSGIMKCIGDDETLKTVELNDGTKIKADVCIMGIGSTFYTDFLKDSGVTMNTNGSIPVSAHMETNISRIYAGGDIVEAPVFSSGNQKACIGHYGLAQLHGRTAALNMVGKKTDLKAVPFFWMMVFKTSFRYAGHGAYDDVRIEGDLGQLKFVAFFLKGDKVVAVATCGRDPVAAQFAEFKAQGKDLTRSDLDKDPFAWAQ